MEEHYCWRCKKVVPMFDESEWAEISPLLANMVEKIKQYRSQYGVDIATAQTAVYQDVLQKHIELTGNAPENPMAVWHHRLLNWGNQCGQCGHLLRSPNANYCANCGAEK